jgi:Tol biopolymer transport system component
LVAYDLDGSIYTIDAGGGEPVRLTDSLADADPAWSPDGSKIAFVGPARTGSNGNLELHTMNVDGSGLTQITSTPGDESDPSWSPDGNSIVVSRRDATDSDIFVIRVDGSGEQALTNDGFDDLDPAFSPDGTRIAFATTRDQVTACRTKRSDCVPAPEIYTMRADGSEQMRITVDIDDDDQGCCGSPDYEPTWSPDGTRIAFERHQSNTLGKPSISVMNSNGTEMDPYLVFSRRGATEPSWLPSGGLIAYTEGVDEPMIAISTAGAGCTRLLTPGSSPSWRPGATRAPKQFCPAPTIDYEAAAERFSGWVDPTGAQYEPSHSKEKRECKADQTLRLMRRMPGPDEKVASTVTDEDGGWSIPWPDSRPGDFYVKLEPKQVITEDGVLVFCAGSRSVVLPVPPIAASYSGPPPVTFATRGARQGAARGTYSWCRAFNYYLGSCLIADAFGYPFPERAAPAHAGATGRITFHRDERPALRYLSYWREVGEFNQPEGRGRRIAFELRRRQGDEFHVWVAVFRIPSTPGEMFINFNVEWDGTRGTGSGGGDYGLHLKVV